MSSVPLEAPFSERSLLCRSRSVWLRRFGWRAWFSRRASWWKHRAAFGGSSRSEDRNSTPLVAGSCGEDMRAEATDVSRTGSVVEVATRHRRRASSGRAAGGARPEPAAIGGIDVRVEPSEAVNRRGAEGVSRRKPCRRAVIRTRPSWEHVGPLGSWFHVTQRRSSPRCPVCPFRTRGSGGGGAPFWDRHLRRAIRSPMTGLGTSRALAIVSFTLMCDRVGCKP